MKKHVTFECLMAEWGKGWIAVDETVDEVHFLPDGTIILVDVMPGGTVRSRYYGPYLRRLAVVVTSEPASEIYGNARVCHLVDDAVA